MVDLLNFAGWTGFPLLLVALGAAATGLLAVGLAAFKAHKPALIAAGLAAGFAFLGVLGGQAGFTSGMRGSYKAVAHASPVDRAAIIAGSEAEAKANITLGFFSLPGALLAAAAVGVAFSRTGASR